MKNQKIIPFERNRYYTGKLLTSSDFQVEQEYFNNKRRFINHVMFGSGIVCGLSVTKADEVSVLIESGVALDSLGREIVVPVDKIKKLSTVENFEKLRSNSMNLYIEYDENEIQPVYSVEKADADTKYENNHIEEKYRVFLVDEAEDHEDIEERPDFLLVKELFETVDYKLEVCMPAVVCAKRWTKIKITAHKMSDAEAEFSYKGELRFTDFSAGDGKNSAQVMFENVFLKKGQCAFREIWVKPSGFQKNGGSHVMLPKETQECLINGVRVSGIKDILFEVVCEDISPEVLVENRIGRMSYKKRSFAFGKKAVFLARICIRRAFESYEITDIDDACRRNYVQTPSFWKLTEEYRGYFRENYQVGNGAFAEKPKLQGKEGASAPAVNIASGIVEIPIGRKIKKGETVFSGETIHGLGTGNVYVTLGTVSADERKFGRGESTVFGFGDIFEGESEAGSFDTAVKVFNDKGSFTVGVRAKKDAACSILKYRWYAVNDCIDAPDEKTDVSLRHKIIAQTPTKVLAPGERCFFNVRFENMEPAPLGYELTEYGGGELTPDGVYTAPDKDGVFEIRIFCAKEPAVCTYAYAVVKRKDTGL